MLVDLFASATENFIPKDTTLRQMDYEFKIQPPRCAQDILRCLITAGSFTHGKFRWHADFIPTEKYIRVMVKPHRRTGFWFFERYEPMQRPEILFHIPVKPALVSTLKVTVIYNGLLSKVHSNNPIEIIHSEKLLQQVELTLDHFTAMK